MVTLAACSGPSVEHDAGFDAGLADAGFDAGADAGTDAGTDAGVDGGADAGTVYEVPIRVLRDGQVPTRLYCLARRDDDAGVALLIDTGSGLSFLSTPQGSPDYVPDAGFLWLGSQRRLMAGRPYAVNETIDGLPVIGFLGNDFFFEQATVIDLAGERIRQEAPWNPAEWTAVPYENRQDYMFVVVELDQVTRRLGFDTGAGDALLLDAGPQPGDQPVQTQDAYGNMLTLYLGTTQLSIDGGTPRTVPLLRAPTFPSLEDSNHALGGSHIDGLFGLSALPGGAIGIDAAHSIIWLRND
ncbi:MAG: hypothetical protein QM723_02760 [Myxococcaceae bacterium]